MIEGHSKTRKVAENTGAGKTVGAPVVATDDDGDTLTYTLTNGDGSTDERGLIRHRPGTGQLLTKVGKLDAEDNMIPPLTDNDDSYGGLQLEVVVRATDPTGDPQIMAAATANSDAVTVMVTVTDVNEAPEVTTTDTLMPFDEDTGNITDVLATYTADDPEAASPVSTWSVGGADGSKFNIGNEDGGTPGLKFKKKPDYEMPTGRQRGQRVRGDGAGVRRQEDRHAGGDGLRHQRGGKRGGDPEQGAAGGRHPGDGHA